MINFGEYNHLIESQAELDGLPYGDTLYLDFETTSGDRKLDSLNPWHNCTPIGFAYTVNDNPHCWFVPWHIAVTAENNSGWLYNLLVSTREWCNQHIKYDAHVLCNDGHVPYLRNALPKCLFDTILFAKLIDADRSFKGGYSLDVLCLHWLGVDLSRYYKSLKPYLVDNQDYGRIPIDILAEYACAQVQANRQLHLFCLANLPPECQQTGLLDVEIALTRVLWQIEQTGLHINPTDVLKADYQCLANMLRLENEIEAMIGHSINPDSSVDLFDLICNRFGQPVLKWTNTDKDGNPTPKSNPSFDKDTLAEYRERIETPESLKPILAKVLEYRKDRQHRSLFYQPWQKFEVNGVIHSNHNQNLVSGRMSCSEPNDQQLDKRAKELIIPKPGYLFVSFDQSQIEYRVCVSCIRNRRSIEAYLNDPDTDFHELIRQWCEIEHRKPAKTINFLTMFRGGRKKIETHLARNFHEMGLHLELWELEQKARTVYTRYHQNLPELKPTAESMEHTARQYGYVLTIGGRRCHLPGCVHNIWWHDGRKIDRCHIAISRVIQGSAADIFKERIVALETDPDSPLKRISGETVALVHDEHLSQIPDVYSRTEAGAKQLIADCNAIREYLEATRWPLIVPLRCDGGISASNWAECDKYKLPRDLGKFEKFLEFWLTPAELAV